MLAQTSKNFIFLEFSRISNFKAALYECKILKDREKAGTDLARENV